MSERPIADLRALAERLDVLKPCECEGLELYWYDSHLDLHSRPCPTCDGSGRRLPTEAEVREAIFEGGATRVETVDKPGAVETIARSMDTRSHAVAMTWEAAPNELVLLALLRALEVARGD